MSPQQASNNNTGHKPPRTVHLMHLLNLTSLLVYCRYPLDESPPGCSRETVILYVTCGSIGILASYFVPNQTSHSISWYSGTPTTSILSKQKLLTLPVRGIYSSWHGGAQSRSTGANKWGQSWTSQQSGKSATSGISPNYAFFFASSSCLSSTIAYCCRSSLRQKPAQTAKEATPAAAS